MGLQVTLFASHDDGEDPDRHGVEGAPVATFEPSTERGFLIGRDKLRNDLWLDDRGISRRHARIFLQDGRLLVEDLQSAGGTYLDGRELHEPQPLTDGAEVRLGGIRLGVRVLGGLGASRVRATDSHGDDHARDAYGDDNTPGFAPPLEPPPADRDATVAVTGARAAGLRSAAAAALPRDFAVELGDRTVVLGRGEGCDVVLPSPVVSREHAEVRPIRDGWAVKNLGSKNGTFVNGEPVERSRALGPGDTLAIGPFRLKFDGASLTREELKAGARIAVSGLVKEVVDRESGRPKRLLDDVSVVIEAGEFVGLMGPVGCGKSTFMGMINGRELDAAGKVAYDGEDLFANLDALKAGISYIPQQVDPQQVIVHQDLPVAEALRFTSRLRLPPDTAPEEVDRLIDRVLRTVKLEHRREVQIKHLSGGQRKKVAVAMELLSRPRVLLADEVTAGMDLGNEQQTMALFRKLADEGMTVVTITHYVDRLKMCDKVACFAGGRLAFYGPPEEVCRFFDVDDLGDVYAAIDAREPEALAADFKRSDHYREHVASHLGLAPGRDREREGGSVTRPPSFSGEDRVRQWSVLTDRYVRLLGLDPTSVGLLLLVAPAVAWLLCVLANSVEAPAVATSTADWMKVATQQNLLCFGSMLTVFFLGLFGAVREVVKELPIFRHERFSNLLVVPYLLSKTVPLSVLSAAHALTVALVVDRWGGLHATSLWQLVLYLWLTGVCGTTSGLLLSSVVKSSDQAVMLMMAVVIPQILFSGAVVPVKGASALIAKGFTVSYWAHDGLKSLLDSTTRRFIDPDASGGAGASWALLALPLHAAAYTALAALSLALKDRRK